jgi:methyl-accepting chemotaxis protein
VGVRRYRDWSLTAKVLVPAATALSLVAVGAAVFIYQQQLRGVHRQAARMAEAVAIQIAETRAYYTKNVVGKLKADGLPVVPGDSRFHGEKGGMPLPATLVKEIGEAVNRRGIYTVDLISPWPINKQKGPRTPFERAALEALARDPKRPQEAFFTGQGDARLVYMAADVASAQACVACHNGHPESPRRDFALGGLMGALVVEIPVGQEIAAAKATAVTVIGVMALAFAGVLAAVGVTMRRFVTRPVGAIIPIFREMAAGGGDLTRRLAGHGEDEVGDLARHFNGFMDKLHQVIVQVRRTATHVAGGAHRLSAASGDLSAGVQEQASSLEETAASLEEITGTVKQTADRAQQARALAAASSQAADRGGQVVARAVSAMEEINDAARRIAEIITAIDEIAFQTNLLALNAAVEAARAGEQGRGFAVVAAEVRALAQRSAAAAREIKGLIQDSVRKVETGSTLVHESGQNLQEIVGTVRRAAELIAEIAAAAQEQSSGIDQVNRAVTQMDQVVQAAANQSEALAATARSLSDEAASLQALVDRFTVKEDAHASAATAPEPPGPPESPAPGSTRPRFTRARPTRAPAVAAARGAEDPGHGQS